MSSDPRSNDPRLPLTVITGYLGAGKTTLVNHLLRHAGGRRLLVLVNDFGDIAIDNDLILSEEGNTLTLANGCICCSLGGDLFYALSDALDRQPRPDHLVIEASGVADPKRISDIARAEPELRHDGTIALVDAASFSDLVTDSRIGTSLERQLKSSDLIVINKTDLVSPRELSRLRERITALVPAAQLIEARFGRVPTDALLGRLLGPEDKDSEPSFQGGEQTHAHAHDHEQDYIRWSLSLDRSFDRARLTESLKELPEGLLRLKGFVRLNDDTGWLLVQIVGRRVELTSQAATPGAAPNTRLAAIGLRGAFDAAQLDRLFHGG